MKKPEIIIIAAIASNGIIGKAGDIPWRFKADFQRFKKLTIGHPCIMSDVTYKSLPEAVRPLPDRENIILTFDKQYKPDKTTIFHDFNDAIEYCKRNQEEKVFITGGSSIYKLGLDVADTLEITHVKRNYEGDVYFPTIDYNNWLKVSESCLMDYDLINQEPFCICFTTYKRKK